MPRYSGNNNNGGGGPPAQQRPGLPQYIEPRCHVCMSDNRKQIDRLIALGTNYTEIARFFELEENINRRSISNHAKRHLNYQEAAIQRIIEQEATAIDANFEEGVTGVMLRRTYLSTALRQAFNDLVNGQAAIEPRDAIAIIQIIERMDEQTGGVQIAEIQRQFSAFLTAIKEILPEDYHIQILNRARELAGENDDDGTTLALTQ